MIIIDGGANKGVYINRFLRKFNNAIIHAFEPQPDYHDLLVKEFKDNKNVVLNCVALGEENNSKDFHSNYGGQTSSLLEWDTPLAEMYTDTAQMNLVNKYPVKIITLKDYCEENGIKEIELMKLDLQGYELRALKGAQNMLFLTHYIMLELTYVPKYVGQSTPEEIEEFLFKRGFNLFRYINPRINKDGVLLWQDGLYCNYVYNNGYNEQMETL